MPRRSRTYQPPKPAPIHAGPSADDLADLAELLAASDSSEQEGLAITKGSERRHAQGALRRFGQFLAVHDCTLEDLRAVADRDRSGYPILPPALLLTYLAEVARPGTTRGTVRYSADKLLRGLRAQGWAAPGLDEGLQAHAPWAEKLQALYSHIEAGEYRPARPVLPGGGLEDIARAIAEIEHPYLRQTMLVFHAVSFWTGARITEVTSLMTWDWFKDLGERGAITFPAGLKYQHRPVTIPLDLYPLEPLACALTQLRALRRMLLDAGLPAGPGNLILPGIRATATGAESVVIDPIASLVDDQTWQPDVPERDTRTALAQATQNASWRDRWKRSAADAGFKSTPQQRVSPHGLRRGLATALDAGGADLSRVQAVLRHGRPVVTFRYIDGSSLDLADINELLDLEDGLSEIAPPSGADLAALLSGRSHSQPIDPVMLDDGRCSVFDEFGERCTHRRAWNPAGLGALCFTHLGRVSAYGPHDPRVLRPTSPVQVIQDSEDEEVADASIVTAMLGDLDWDSGCTAEHDGVACGWRRDEVWSYLQGGRRTVMCFLHIQRLLAGDPDWSRPRKVCEVTHPDADGLVMCGEPGYCQVGTDDTTKIQACQAHYSRWVTGKRGAALTKPIRAAIPERCEVVHEADGTVSVCGKATISTIQIEDVRTAVCGAHYRRWRTNKRGAAFTQPIMPARGGRRAGAASAAPTTSGGKGKSILRRSMAP